MVYVSDPAAVPVCLISYKTADETHTKKKVNTDFSRRVAPLARRHETYVFVGLATPAILPIHRKPRSAQTPPNALLRSRIIELESHLRLSGDGPDTDEAPDDLEEEETAVCQNRVPDLGLGLETSGG